MSSINELNKTLEFWQKDKSNVSLCREVLMHYASQKRLDDAQVFLANLSEELRVNQELLRILGQTYLNCGFFTKAREQFESLVEDEQRFRSYSIALCLYFEQDFARAHSILEKVVTDQTDVAPEISLLFARVLYQLGDIERAFKLAKPLNFINPKTHSEQLGLLAMLSLDLDNKIQARDYAEQCLSLAPKQHDGLLAKASCLVVTLETVEAIRVSTIGTQQFSNSGRFWSVLSQAQMQEQQFDLAYVSICKATALMPNHIGSWHIKGWLELVSNRVADARGSFRSALELNHNFAESHGALGIVAVHENNIPEAETHIKKSIRLNPSNFAAIYGQSLLALAKGDSAHSDELIQGILNQESHLGSTFSQLIATLQK